MSICPVCRKIYKSPKTQILQIEKPFFWQHSNCPFCGKNVLSFVADLGVGKSTLNMITDLSFDDLVKAEKRGEITDDQMIDIHQKLESSSIVKLSLINQ